jgi:hypothetical protein
MKESESFFIFFFLFFFVENSFASTWCRPTWEHDGGDTEVVWGRLPVFFSFACYVLVTETSLMMIEVGSTMEGRT